MRRLLPFAALALLLAAAPLSRADDDPRAIIERAVKALGGLEKLEQVKAVHRRSRGVYHEGNIVFSGESHSQSPDRLRLVINSRDPDDPQRRMLVLEGDKGWLRVAGTVIDLDEEMQARFKQARYSDRVSGLVALLKDKEKKYTLTTLGESKVKGKPAVGVKVASAGHTDIELYFDKETGLLMKSAQRVTEPRKDNDALHEWYFSDYKVLDLAAPDEALLKKAQVPADGPALLAWLKKRTPGPELRARVQGLIKQLGARGFRARTQATEELKKLPVEAGALLREALKSPDPEVVRRAEQCLDHFRQNPEAPLTPAAVRLIALRRPAEALPVLLAYLQWAPDEATADEVRATLVTLSRQDGKTAPDLVRALQDNDPMIRRAAAEILGKDGGKYLARPGRRIIVEGLRFAVRSELYREGRRAMEMEVLDIQVFNRLDDSLFARP
jgi:HEAT repeat protein